MKKKLVSLFLAVVMILTLCTPAFAAETLPYGASIQEIFDGEYYVEANAAYGLVLHKLDDGQMQVSYYHSSNPGKYYHSTFLPQVCTYAAVRSEVLAGNVSLELFMDTTAASRATSLTAAMKKTIINDCSRVDGAAYAYRPYKTVSTGGYSVQIKMMKEYFVTENETVNTYMKLAGDIVLILLGFINPASTWAVAVSSLGLVSAVINGKTVITSDHVIMKCYCSPTTRKTGYVNSKTGYTASYYDEYPYAFNVSTLKYMRNEISDTKYDVYYYNDTAIARESVDI